MGRPSKLLLDWREPEEVVRAHARSPRRLIVRSLVMIVLGAGLVACAVARAPRQDAPLAFLLGGLLAGAGVWMPGMWISRSAPRRVRLCGRRKGSMSSSRKLPGAVAIVNHPLCPSYRALLVIDRDGGKSFVGIPHEVSDDDIRRAWPQSQWGDVPLQASDKRMPKPRMSPMPGDWFFRRRHRRPYSETGVMEDVSEEPAAPDEERASTPGKTLFQWPDPPRYWPTVLEKRSRVSWFLVYFLIIWPITIVSVRILVNVFSTSRVNESVWQDLRSMLFLNIPYALGVGLVWTLGAFFGWNDNVVRLAENEILFFGLLKRKAYFLWTDVKEVALHLSSYADTPDRIEVVYDYYGVQGTFAMNLRSKRLEDERLARALSDKAGTLPEATETPDGVTIRVNGFGAAPEAPSK